VEELTKILTFISGKVAFGCKSNSNFRTNADAIFTRLAHLLLTLTSRVTFPRISTTQQPVLSSMSFVPGGL
jgi:hypothetical protein